MSTSLPLHSTQSKELDPKSNDDHRAEAKHSADPVLWAMQHMDLDGAAKLEEKAGAKANVAEGHFPVPTGRPGRPPALVKPQLRSAGGPAPATGTNRADAAN